jgi:hypothetical protein
MYFVILNEAKPFAVLGIGDKVVESGLVAQDLKIIGDAGKIDGQFYINNFNFLKHPVDKTPWSH